MNNKCDEEYREIKNTSLSQKSLKCDYSSGESKSHDQIDSQNKTNVDQHESYENPLTSKYIYYR